MVWFKVDDSFYDHPKVFDAPDCAVALWTRAGSWSARNLTDGFVPAGMPARFCDDPDTAIKELVRRRLWERVKDGYRFHDWSDSNPTREDVERDREAAAERKRRQRARMKEQVSPDPVTHVSRRDSRGTHTGSHGVSPPSPTRPDPTITTTTGPYVAPGRNARARDEPPPTDSPPTRVEQLITSYRDDSPRGIPTRQAERLAAEIHQLVTDGYTDTEIRAGLSQLRARRLGPAMLPGLVDELANQSRADPGNVVALRNNPRPTAADQRVADGLALAARLAAQEAT